MVFLDGTVSIQSYGFVKFLVVHIGLLLKAFKFSHLRTQFPEGRGGGGGGELMMAMRLNFAIVKACEFRIRIQ